MVVPDMIQNLRHDSETKIVTIVTKQSSRFIVRYQEVMKLDLEDTGEIYIYDWFDFRAGSQNSPDIIRGEDDAPLRMVLYPTRRPKVKKGIRDFVAISRIKEVKASLWDYSEMAININVSSCSRSTASKDQALVILTRANHEMAQSRLNMRGEK